MPPRPYVDLVTRQPAASKLVLQHQLLLLSLVAVFDHDDDENDAGHGCQDDHEYYRRAPEKRVVGVLSHRGRKNRAVSKVRQLTA